MEYTCIKVRFSFWNGEKKFTVEFVYGIVSTWYIFNDNQITGAVFYKTIVPSKSKTPNRELAKEVLDEYLNNL